MADPDIFQQYTGMSQQSVLGGTTGNGLPLMGAAGSNKWGPQSTVYLPGHRHTGSTPGTGQREGGQFDRATSRVANTRTAEEARQEPLRWFQNDPETLQKFVNSGVLNKVPGFDVGMGIPEVMAAWDKLLEQSWMMNKYSPEGAQKYTPWDVLNSYSNNANKFGTIRRGDWEYDVATGEKVKYVGPKSKTQTSKRIDLSSPEDVRAIATNALAQLLGRAPTQEELGKFKASINSLEEKNPLMATTTETLNDMGEVVNTETKQSGGLSAEARALAVSDQAKAGPEYGKFQSGTTYWGALMQMMGGG